MNMLSHLNDLVGKKGLLKIAGNGEVGFTFLSVDPPLDLPAEGDLEAFHNAVSLSSFRVRFDEGILVEGTDTRVISGQYISRLD